MLSRILCCDGFIVAPRCGGPKVRPEEGEGMSTRTSHDSNRDDWHMSGPHFRDYHLLLDEQAGQIFAIGDDIAERVRKVGGTTIRSVGHIAKLQRIADNDQQFVDARDMLLELHADNRSLVENLRSAHEIAGKANDYATTSLIEVWIDEAERRAWFLFEATR